MDFANGKHYRERVIGGLVVFEANERAFPFPARTIGNRSLSSREVPFYTAALYPQLATCR